MADKDLEQAVVAEQQTPTLPGKKSTWKSVGVIVACTLGMVINASGFPVFGRDYLSRVL